MPKWLKITLITITLTTALLAIFGPYEDTKMRYQEFNFGDDLDQYLANEEAQFPNITEDAQKQILWAEEKGHQTPIAVVYLHGFSATHYELRPVPQILAKGLGANLYLSRLTGHGLPGEELGKATAEDWLNDLQEAIAIGQKLGQKVILLTTSTGGTLAAIAAKDETLAPLIDGIIFVSPNFKIKDPKAPLLTLPAARHWVPLIGGKERSWEPANPMQEKYWTTAYPTTVVFPLAALVKKARRTDYGDVSIPAFFYYVAEDQVVEAKATDKIVEKWGGDVEVFHPLLSADADESNHVIAGDIISPSQTDLAAEMMLDWSKRNVE